MRRRRTFFGAFATLAAFFCVIGCSPKGTVSASVVNGLVTPVLERHDAYVAADTTLSDLDRREFTADSEILRGIIDAGLEAEDGN